MADVDLDDSDSLRIFGWLARALNAAGVVATIAALKAVAEQSDDDRDDDADVPAASANSRADGRRILAPDPPGDGPWSTPSLMADD